MYVCLGKEYLLQERIYLKTTRSDVNILARIDICILMTLSSMLFSFSIKVEFLRSMFWSWLFLSITYWDIFLIFIFILFNFCYFYQYILRNTCDNLFYTFYLRIIVMDSLRSGYMYMVLDVVIITTWWDRTKHKSEVEVLSLNTLVTLFLSPWGL